MSGDGPKDVPVIPLTWLTWIKIGLLVPDAIRFITWAKEVFGPDWETRMLELRAEMKAAKSSEEKRNAARTVLRRFSELSE